MGGMGGMAVTVGVTGNDMRMARKRAQRRAAPGTQDQADTTTETLKKQLTC